MFEIVESDIPNVRVQRSPQVDFLAALRATTDHFEVSRDSPTLLVVHRAGLLITDPGVRSSSARVHPHDVLEPEVFPQRHVHDFDSHRDELPAPVADVRLVTACTDVVVIC